MEVRRLADVRFCKPAALQSNLLCLLVEPSRGRATVLLICLLRQTFIAIALICHMNVHHLLFEAPCQAPASTDFCRSATTHLLSDVAGSLVEAGHHIRSSGSCLSVERVQVIDTSYMSSKVGHTY